MKKTLIVGFDPGTTAAYGILDTDGNLVHLQSKKGLKGSDVLGDVTARGKPLIVATDRNPLPKSVQKLAKLLGSKVYYPARSLSTSEKSALIKSFRVKMKNDHERDALASAYKAYNFYADLFRRTRYALDATGMSRHYPEVISKVVFEEEENISKAIESVIAEIDKKRMNRKESKGEIERASERDVPRKIKELQEEVKRREKDIMILSNYNRDLKNKLSDANKSVDYYKRRLKRRESAAMKQIKIEGKEMERSLKEMKKLRDIELGGYLPVIEIEKMESSIIKRLDNLVDLKKRVLFTKDASNAQMLNDYDILVLITSRKPDDKVFEKADFPIVLENNITLEKKNGYRAVSLDDLERELKSAKKEGLIEWIKLYRRRRL